MTKLIPAKCPNCAANLEFPETTDVGHCMHCGANVIIDREVHVQGQASMPCPNCGGKGMVECKGQQRTVKDIVKPWGWETTVESCNGTGKCNYHTKPAQDPSAVKLCRNGKCDNCNGKGRAMLRKCEFCDGSGTCPACNGTGKCIFCNGAGHIPCAQCKGTGFKVYKG